MAKEICQTCNKEIELLPKEEWRKGKSKWIHSSVQNGRYIGIREAENLAEHEAIPKKS